MYVRRYAAPHAASSPTARTARSTQINPTCTPTRIRATGKGMTYGSGRHDLRHVAHVGKLKRWQPRVGDGGADNTSSRQNPSIGLARKLTPPCWAHLNICPSADPPQQGTLGLHQPVPQRRTGPCGEHMPAGTAMAHRAKYSARAPCSPPAPRTMPGAAAPPNTNPLFGIGIGLSVGRVPHSPRNQTMDS